MTGDTRSTDLAGFSHALSSAVGDTTELLRRYRD